MITMNYKLFAFDLDGTLLDDEKRISPATLLALNEIVAAGARIVFATGRIGSSMFKYIPSSLDDVALLTLNGAEVRTGPKAGSKLVHSASLSANIADHLIGYYHGRPFALNYYIDNALYAVRDEMSNPWIDYYYKQTGSEYRFVDSLDPFRGRRPSKIIFVGAPAVIDEQERFFKEQWKGTVYVCRTCDHYLEFLDPAANKAEGLEALARFYNVGWDEIVTFGDAENDIPMLRKAGLGIATANAPDFVKQKAGRVSQWTNNEDCIAREWELIKNGKL